MKVGDLVKWAYGVGIVTHIYTDPFSHLTRVLYHWGESDTVTRDLTVISESW